ncbi:acetyl-CoA C-acetyltransferase [Isoptericola sp. b441]|uniref:Probable acetyl-CoA acetyltransferase n=1 Tax=Actinotalea lenta TaxID=3064654 RepID=A0ABT9DBB9_9CELL|nr:acetyl-CoA C-acetyltransferase [Isoptericola sp. b441]MDO8107589.1 acetyl-CoA C-acetyltransferase [Isoptericola sp. b441]
MTDLYLVSACRTAIGSFGGSLKDVPPATLGTIVVAEALARAGVAPDQVDEVLLGCILTAGAGQNVARQAAIGAGIPAEVTATTVNMLCGSGMKTIVEGARAILAGDAHVVVVGGTENMSAAPYVVPAARWGARMGDASMRDTMLTDGLTDAFSGDHMGVTAENVAQRWGISRDRMDAFALESQSKAAAAVAAGRFAEEIVPVPVRVRRETVEFAVDEYPRSTTAEALASLRPAFMKDGTVTAGSASGINDGAAALVLASGEAVAELGLTPMVKLIGWGQAGVDPAIMGVGPIEATRRALARANLAVDDLDLVEANEAFAAQALAVGGDLGWDWDRVNVNGGAIALGHPIGASGARIVVTLVHEMARRGSRYGLATLCIGGGMGIASVYEAC